MYISLSDLLGILNLIIAVLGLGYLLGKDITKSNRRSSRK
jgi:hypothetical protein